MKVRLLVLLAVAAMPLMGFNCINDPFYAAINVKPIAVTFPVDGVSVTKGYGPISTADYYDTGYSLKDISVFDLKIATNGASLGQTSFTVGIKTTSTGAYQDILTCTGPWSDFSTPQSIFNTKYFTLTNGAALNTLITNAFNGNRLYVQVKGTVANAPASAVSNTVTVSLYIQATGSANN
jgi:hypothetical protein